MFIIPNSLLNEFVAYLTLKNIPSHRIAEYKKWLRYFLDYCDKYPVPCSKSERIRLFCNKLKEKK